MNIPSSFGDEEIKAAALENEKIKEATDGKQVLKVIVVKGRLVNIVVK